MRTPAIAGAWRAALALGLLLLLSWGPVARAAPDGPAVAVLALDRPLLAGRLVALDAEGVGVQGDDADAPRTLPLDRIREVRFLAAQEPAAPARRVRARLTGGDVLVGTLEGPAEEGVLLGVGGLGTVRLLFENVLTLEILPADAGPCADLADRHPRAESGDVAYDARDDEYRGTVTATRAEGLVIESARGTTSTVAWDALKVLHLENDVLPAAGGLEAEVELVGGSRIAVRDGVTFADGVVRCGSRSVPASAWSIPTASVRVVRWWGGRFVYATTLQYRSTRTPYYEDPEGATDPAVRERWWGARVDRRDSGCPLRVGGETFRRGFGVNSRSVIEIPLAGRFTRFRAGFGIDDEVLTVDGAGTIRGDVDARVLADGKVLWEAKGVQGGQPLRTIGPVDVAGVQTLVLEVGFGQGFMTLDRADWLDPILELE